jgi:hypothetical protein
MPIAQIGLMGSIYCTMALALERFFAVCHPFLPRRYLVGKTKHETLSIKYYN